MIILLVFAAPLLALVLWSLPPKTRISSALPLLPPVPATPATPVRLAPNRPLACIGDSITAHGGYLRICDRALARLAPELRLPPIANLGVPGQKVEDLAARFEQDVIPRHPQIVFLNIGVNDVWHRLGRPHDPQVLAAYARQIADMVDLAQANNIQMVLLTPTLVGEDPESEGNRRLALYADAMKTVAREKSCGLVDLHALFMEAFRHKPPGSADPWLTSDGIHMSPLGNAVIAVGLLRSLEFTDADLATLP